MNTATHRPASFLASLAALLPAIVLACAPALQAQPVLALKRIVNNWPTIELYFTVACNGQPKSCWNISKGCFHVVENGVEIKDFSLWGDDNSGRCCTSSVLVFDASGSMSGSGNAGAKTAGNAYVDMMDGWTDEAEVLWFHSAVTIAQGMTTSLDLLHTAINALPAGGGTAVWDAAYQGILELIGNGVCQCRAVVVLVDGMDNASSRTPAEIIALANRNRVRVTTVALGGPVNSAQLQSIARLTGGRYYETPTASQLVSVYQEIYNRLLFGTGECGLAYVAGGEDGSLRNVELTLSNFCNGADTVTSSYRAPLTGIDDPAQRVAAFELFPDPSRGELTLRVPSRPGDAIRVIVSDALGRVLLAREETSASELHECAVAVVPPARGVVMIAVETGGRRWMRTARLY